MSIGERTEPWDSPTIRNYRKVDSAKIWDAEKLDERTPRSICHGSQMTNYSKAAAEILRKKMGQWPLDWALRGHWWFWQEPFAWMWREWAPNHNWFKMTQRWQVGRTPLRSFVVKGREKNITVSRCRKNLTGNCTAYLYATCNHWQEINTQKWRSHCKAGGLALGRRRDGSFLVTGRPLATNTHGLADLVVVVVGWLHLSPDCFYFLIVIIRVRMGRGYARSRTKRWEQSHENKPGRTDWTD